MRFECIKGGGSKSEHVPVGFLENRKRIKIQSAQKFVHFFVFYRKETSIGISDFSQQNEGLALRSQRRW